MSSKCTVSDLLVCKGIAAVSEQMARHDGAAIPNAALVQLR